MSADDPGKREVARRLFAAEYDDADYSYSESDEERAPNYVVTPTGGRVNRLFVVGVLTEVTRINDDTLRGRVADPTGAFVVYAGQYQPDEQAVLEQMESPAFVAVTGKANTFQPEDSDTVYTSIRPESINAVGAETRDRWTVRAAEQTLARVNRTGNALSTGLTGDRLRERLADQGVDPALADGIARAITHYGTTPGYLAEVRDLALDAARVVAGRRDEVRGLSAAPDDPGDATAEDVVATTPEPVDPADTDEPTAETATANESAGSGEDDAAGETGASDAETTVDDTTETGVEPETETTPEGVEPADDEDGAPEETTVGDPGEFDADEFDLTEEVREEVESEFGTEFRSGTEVDDPGEADIPTAEAEAEAETDTGRSEGTDESDDPQDAVLAVMEELDDGTGADRAAIVRETGERHGLDEETVEAAIQEALMDGKCYEPDERSLKPI